jgi:hypothetical protein
LKKTTQLNNIIILDLDGVLINTPQWKPDRLHTDGYFDFNQKSVINLNKILEETGYDIILSSTRRTKTDIDLMNQYFKNRGIIKPIIGYVPEYDVSTRLEEIELFLAEHDPTNYLIIDDDKSLSGGSDRIKNNWKQTYYLVGL